MRIAKILALVVSGSMLAHISVASAQVVSDPDGNTAVGTSAGSGVTGRVNTAVGVSSGQGVSGDGNTALGSSSGQQVSGNDNTALGTSAGVSVVGSGNVSIGLSAGSGAQGNSNIAIGVGAGQSSPGSGKIQIGASAGASTNDAIAIGSAASVIGLRGTAIGFGASSSGMDSVVIGVGSSDGGEAQVVSVGNANLRRRVTNVAGGNVEALSSDAVNGGQLFTTNQNVTVAQTTATQGLVLANRANAGLVDLANAFGAGAQYDSATGAFFLPSYSVGGTSFRDVGSAIDELDNNAEQLSSVAVRYEDATRSRVVLGAPGASPVAVRNVAAGSVAASSTDAVNGGQLFTTNQNLAAARAAADGARSRAEVANGGISAAVSVFGGNAFYDAGSGSFQGPSFFVRGNSYSDVGSALVALDDNIAQSDTIAVRYDDQGRTSVSLGGSRPGLLGEAVAVRNVADGTVDSSSTDAVNGSQLFAVSLNVRTAQETADRANSALSMATAGLGGGASYDAAAGTLQGPTYALSAGSFSTVGDALASLDGDLVATRALAVNSVQYDDPSRSRITLGGGAGGPVGLSNVASGVVSSTSTDAVNGAQLFATNQMVAQNAADIVSLTSGQQVNSTAITNLMNSVANGTVGLVQQAGGAPGAGVITVGATTGGTSVDFAGTSGQRSLTGVASGSLTATSTDAVNGAQLFNTNQNVATAQRAADRANSALGRAAASLGGGAAYDSASGAWTGPSFTIAGIAHNDVGSALAALDDEIAGVGAVTANAVLYDDQTHSSVTLGGAGGGAVAVKNVAAANLSAGSTDAVNGAQLFATNQQLAQNTSAIAASAAQTAALSTAIGNGTIGLVQQTGGDPNGAVTVGASTGGKSVSVAGSSGTRTVTGVSAGLVSATSSDAVNGAQLFALGERVNSADGRILGLQRDLNGLKYDLRRFGKNANSGIATAVALGSLPQATNPGRFAVGMGTGIRDGQLAVAIGASWRSKDDMFVVNLRGGYDQSAVTAGAGVGIEF